MRKLVLIGGLLLLVACRRGSPKLEGHWRGFRADGVDQNAQVQAQSFAQNTEIIAQGDKIAIQTPNGRSPTTIYVVDKEDPTTVVIHTEKDGTTETFTFNEKGDLMTWRIDTSRAIVFKKVP